MCVCSGRFIRTRRRKKLGDFCCFDRALTLSSSSSLSSSLLQLGLEALWTLLQWQADRMRLRSRWTALSCIRSSSAESEFLIIYLFIYLLIFGYSAILFARSKKRKGKKQCFIMEVSPVAHFSFISQLPWPWLHSRCGAWPFDFGACLPHWPCAADGSDRARWFGHEGSDGLKGRSPWPGLLWFGSRGRCENCEFKNERLLTDWWKKKKTVFFWDIFMFVSTLISPHFPAGPPQNLFAPLLEQIPHVLVGDFTILKKEKKRKRTCTNICLSRFAGTPTPLTTTTLAASALWFAFSRSWWPSSTTGRGPSTWLPLFLLTTSCAFSLAAVRPWWVELDGNHFIHIFLFSFLSL